MSTHNIGFYEEISKIITKLSSNTHLISSADTLNLNKRSLNTCTSCLTGLEKAYHPLHLCPSSSTSFFPVPCRIVHNVHDCFENNRNGS